MTPHPFVKQLLGLLICFLPFLGFAQNGGTAFVVPVSGGTSSSVVSGTNSIVFTNICYESYTDTNVLRVFGAGTATANVNFQWDSVTGRFTNGSQGIAYNSGGFGWELTNGAGDVLYFSGEATPTVTNGWDALIGAPPDAEVTYGLQTNCFVYVVSTATFSPGLLSSNLYVNAHRGNDTNAVRGDPYRAWRNIQPALAATIPGDNVILGEGHFPTNAAFGNNIYVSNFVSIIGQGPGLSIIGTDAGGSEEGMQIGSGVKLYGFTLFGQVNVGSLVRSTNSVIEWCNIVGVSDAIYVTDFYESLTINRSRLVSTYDGLADWSFRPGASNWVIRFNECDILVTNGTFNTLHGISGGDSRIEMFGGSIDVRDGQFDNYPVYLSVDVVRTNKSGSVLLSNVRLRSTPTNGVKSEFVTNFNRLPVIFDNCTMETVRPVLVSGSYTQYASDRLIAFPNGAARTNWLPNLTTISNSLISASMEGFRVTILDEGATATGTNIWVGTRDSRTINGGPTITNITTDRGMITFGVLNGQWKILGAFP